MLARFAFEKNSQYDFLTPRVKLEGCVKSTEEQIILETDLPGIERFSQGKVRDVYFPGEGQPGTPLLAVDTSRGEVLVPLAEDICTMIEITSRRIEVKLPAGLRDLNP